MAVINIREVLSKDLISTTANQLWRLVSGPVLMVLIPLFVTPEVQGFWYTFGSISALSIFADLGFTTIVCQFAAHEFAFLEFDDNFNITGPSQYCERLSSLFRFILKWTVLVVCVVFPLIFIVGYILFIQKATINVWLLPWLLYSIGAAFSFINGVIASFVQGCGQVANIQRIGLRQAICNTIVVLLCLILHFNLYALAFGTLLSNTAYTLLLLLRYRIFFSNLLKQPKIKNNWGRDVLSLLWKYAISWSSGYFVFQIYTPFMFQFHGPVEAGKVGITMSLVSAIFNISNTWFTANTPKINMYVAKREWSLLDKEFRTNLLLTVATYIMGISVLAALIVAFHGRWLFFDNLAARFLGIIPIATLSLGWFCQIFVSGMAVYLRAHMQEPYVTLSFFNGLFIFISTYLCSRYLPSCFLFIGFLSSFAFVLPWAYSIYKSKKIAWHAT